MARAGCPDWEYEDVPEHRRLISAAVKGLLIRLRQGRIDTSLSTRDTRPVHTAMFEGLAPTDHSYYAGSYRGSRDCLVDYEVGVRGDPRVGVPSTVVAHNMDMYDELLRAGLDALDVGSILPDATVTPEQKLYCTVVFACRVFEEFLRIHPYANGNGHMGRWIIWCILGRFGYWPSKWPIEPRPPDPPYTGLIREYRNGMKEPLERFVLSCLE